MQEQERMSSDGNIHDAQRLKELQALPLDRKIGITQARIMEFYREFDGQVYVSFSGGKDSTVLLDITRKLFPEVEAVFVDTGLEWPEIRKFVKTIDNVTWLKPEMNFKKVIEKYGYPVIGKEVALLLYYARNSKNKKENYMNILNGNNIDGTNSEFKQRFKKYKFLLDSPFKISSKCCQIMKESPLDNYARRIKKHRIVGIMATESTRRKQAWIKTGCNDFGKIPSSKPMSFWTEQDVLEYLYKLKIPYASIYGDIIYEDGKYRNTGEPRTGCMFCMFGVQCEKEPNKFQRMKESHPKIYDYCMKDVKDGGLGLEKVLDFIGIKY